MKHDNLIVQKYGGVTLSTPEKIKLVAKHSVQQFKSGQQLVIVVSAMGNSTNDLMALAKQVSKNPDPRELDMLISTGERVSMALLCMAIIDQGVPAISFTGSQAGILTDQSHVDANIIEVQPLRVVEALQKNKIVVIAGFQGMSKQTKEITTLGRGGSDTTAVAMCSALGARSCQILKDFPGVYTADPKVVKDAQVISELTYDQLIEMTGSGAKMVHSRAAIMAKEKQIKLEIIAAASSDRTAAAGREGGTSISKFSDPKKSRPSINVLQIDQSSSQVTVTLPELASDKKLTEITAFLSQSKINFKFDKTFGHSMAFRVSSTDLDLCLQSLHKFLINT